MDPNLQQLESMMIDLNKKWLMQEATSVAKKRRKKSAIEKKKNKQPKTENAEAKDVYRVEHEVNASPIELDEADEQGFADAQISTQNHQNNVEDDDVGVNNTSWAYDDSAGIRDCFQLRGNHLAALNWSDFYSDVKVLLWSFLFLVFSSLSKIMKRN
ncbi:unnamed protein product [Adineta ricciae]|uniref:Uncharacterized protein n=1 Tax=Adineta ricciae TaxID=249248 RepID=A0A815MCA5_ADIRI|nr:unnamed protein product [Adineta ricciae]